MTARSSSALPLHVVFNASAAAGLRDALREVGREDRVIALKDCLSFGPINPPAPAIRTRWVEDVLGYSGWDQICIESAAFWGEALSSNTSKIVWASRRSAQEHAGFLEWLSRIGDELFEFVDLTGIEVLGRAKNGERSSPHLAISLALLPPYQILESGLLESSKSIEASQRDQYRRQWATLCTENAPFRVLSQGSLRSAPITVFDSAIMSHVTFEWRKAALVVGHALTDFYDTSVIQTGDLVLASRLRALAQASQLEARGDLSNLHSGEVRLSKR